MGTWENSKQKNFEVSSSTQYLQFSRKEKWKRFRLIATTFSLLELTLLKIVSIQLGISFFHHSTPLSTLYSFWKVNTKVFSLVVFFHKLSI